MFSEKFRIGPFPGTPCWDADTQDITSPQSQSSSNCFTIAILSCSIDLILARTGSTRLAELRWCNWEEDDIEAGNISSEGDRLLFCR